MPLSSKTTLCRWVGLGAYKVVFSAQQLSFKVNISDVYEMCCGACLPFFLTCLTLKIL